MRGAEKMGICCGTDCISALQWCLGTENGVRKHGRNGWAAEERL